MWIHELTMSKHIWLGPWSKINTCDEKFSMGWNYCIVIHELIKTSIECRIIPTSSHVVEMLIVPFAELLLKLCGVLIILADFKQVQLGLISIGKLTTITLLVFVVIWRKKKHYESCEMKHELTRWKWFVPDTPSFSDHIWIFKYRMMFLHSNVSSV